MLNNIIELSLKQKLLVIVLFMTLSFLGYRSYNTVPIDAFPDITPKQVVIYTESAGNSAEDIEKLITYPLESALSGMAGVKSIMSNSIFGLSYISIFFEEGYDIYFLRQQVAERILSVDIPQGWGKPTLGPNTTGLGQVFWYELHDATHSKSLQEIRELQEFFVKPMFKSVAGVEEVTSVKSFGGRAVTIGDVATVQKGNAPRFGAISIDGNESVLGMVLQRTGTDANRVVEGLKAKMKQVNASLPKGVSIRLIYDRTEMTQKAVATISNALIMGMGLVAIVLFLFLFELRSAFIVIISLPLSLLIAFLLMEYFGLSANLMSLSGLAIAVGMIVDGTIVMVENAYRHLNKTPNANRLTLILTSAKEVATPVTFAILIIVAVFIPLLSLDGLAGKLYSPMALNIVFVMLGSLLVALVLVPVLSLALLKPKKSQENIVMRSVKWLYLPFLKGALHFPKLVLLFVSLAFISLAYLLTLQGREFMPTLNEESIMYRVIAPPGRLLVNQWRRLNISKNIS